jgi:hypothetical protein
MNDAHGAPGRTNGRAQPPYAQNTDDRDLLAALGLEDKASPQIAARTSDSPPY